jgi:inhibitor of cysteine peptidase
MRSTTFSEFLLGNPRLRSRTVLAVLLGLVLTPLMGGCWFFPPTETGIADLEGFANAMVFKEYLADQVDAERSRWADEWGFLPDMAPSPPASGADDASSAEPSNGGDYSTTNLQEEGVDESDLVKNDGTYLYILSGNTLRIVRAFPADEMAVLSTTELQGTPSELYLRGDTAIVLGTDYAYADDYMDDWYCCYWGSAVITVLDVTDRSAPETVASMEVEGSLSTSRLIGSKLHLVLSVWPALPATEGRMPILLSDVAALIPDVTITMHDGESTTRDLVNWRDIYHPVDPDGYEMTTVVTWDVDEPSETFQSIGVMANAGTVYVSPRAMYLADRDSDYWGNQRETTDIYRFDLDEDGARFVGAGSVRGRLLNRFSLGEYEDHLRVATTVGHVFRTGDNSAKNNVYVLRPEGEELAVVGSVEDIAPGERIYSARFIGERGFLVTFKKVDPLFTLDLSVPTAPRVVGELKVPGYSDYIHPLGENHLLTIGKDAVDMGEFAWYQGVQLSVFDVTDFAHPQRVDVEVIGERGTESEALRNPHAFNYFAPLEMLAIPMSIAEGADPEEPSSYGRTTFQGLCLFHVTAAEGIEPLFQIPMVSLDEEDEPWRGYSYLSWARGIFIGEYVYAVTHSKVLAVPLREPGAGPIELILDSQDAGSG